MRTGALFTGELHSLQMTNDYYAKQTPAAKSEWPMGRRSCSSSCAKSILVYSNAASHGDLRLSCVAFQGPLRLLMHALTWEDGEARIPIIAKSSRAVAGEVRKDSIDACGVYPAFPGLPSDERATELTFPW
jgi:hypothetical protein